MRLLAAVVVAILLLPVASRAQRILVDHRSVALFDSIPAQYREAARNLRLLFMDRSVGGNISDALTCLSFAHSAAPSYCKRHTHRDSAYAVSPSEVFWNGTWDRSRWRYEFWPTGCGEDANCFVNFIEPRIDSFDVVGFQFSYLAVTPGSNLVHPLDGFFGSRIDRGTATSYKAFAARHPQKTVIWWTTSLARGIGSPESQAFNTAMRDYARLNDLVLFDVADILAHTPSGAPCYDNRDGVQYLTENHPDDGVNIPAICPQYTTETEGGHLGSISAGGIRVAKAFWVLMARIAGWDGGGGTVDPVPEAPTLIAPSVGATIEADTVHFSWQPVAGPVLRYALQLARDAGFQQELYRDTSITTTTALWTQPPVDSTVYWRVRARNAMGWGPWSEIRSFRRIATALFSATPLTEMGRSLYQSFAGGLYPDTRNVPPEAHYAEGLRRARAIVPLDTLGRPDPEHGSIVLLSLGMSNTGQEFTVFESVVDTFAARHPRLVTVNGGVAGQTASIIRDSDAQYWRVVESERLYRKRVTPAQVQIVWLKQANAQPRDAFPLHARQLEDDLRAIVRLLPEKFPNISLCYLSSRTYGGYATTPLNPEPYAYESGFAVRWVVGAQIEGDTALAYATPARAPWLAWGPYLWTNGAQGRADGLQWLTDDVVTDGTHPSEAGKMKVAQQLLRFFSTDSTAMPWFLAPAVTAMAAPPRPARFDARVIPHPLRDRLQLELRTEAGTRVRAELWTLTGQLRAVLVDAVATSGSMRYSAQLAPLGLRAGSYLLRIRHGQHDWARVVIVLP